MNILLITGAKGMLGQCLVNHFALFKDFHKIISIDLVDNKCPSNRGEEFFKLDIVNEELVQKFFKDLPKKYNNINCIYLINCAGINVFDDHSVRKKRDFMKVLEVNLYGTFNMIQKTTNFALEKGIECSIVNTGSLFGKRSPDERNYVDLKRKNSEVYGASKAGIEQMTRYFGAHLGKYNIRVNCVSPGGIFNEVSPQGEKFQKLYNYKVPLGRMGFYSEMIGAYEFFLINTKSSYITGQVINVDGGYTSW